MLIRGQHRGTPRILPRYHKFLMSVYTRTEMMKDRFIKSDIGTSPSLTFIKYMLLQLSEPRYIKDDILDLYLEYIGSEAAMVSRKFDSTQSGVATQKNVFIKGDKTKEFMIPTNGIIGSEVSILDEWDKWESIQPIKLLAHDSRELYVDFYGSQLEFKKDQPTFAVIGIDCKALLMKYIIYLREFNIDIDNPHIDDFIIKHILPFIYDDFTDVWITNTLVQVLEDSPIDTKLISNVLSTSELTNGLAEVTDLVNKYKNGNIEIGDILKSFFYFDNTLDSLIETYENTYACYYGNRYLGAMMVKMTGLMRIYLLLLQVTVERKKNTASIVYAIKQLDILKRKKYSSHVRDDNMLFEIERLIAEADMLQLLSETI